MNSNSATSIYEEFDNLPAAAKSSMANSNGTITTTGPTLAVGSGVGRLGDSLTTLSADSSSILTNIKIEPQSADDTTSATSPSSTIVQSSSTPTNTTTSPTTQPSSTLDTLLSSTPDMETDSCTTVLNGGAFGDSAAQSSIGALLSGATTTLADSPPPAGEDVQPVEAETYCKLGHFHLLLEDFPKGELLFYIFW